MDPTAQRCSHRLHSAATSERHSHCLVAPAVPLLVVIGTVDKRSIYIFRNAKLQMNGKEERKERKRCQGEAGQVEGGRAYFSVLCQVNL